MNTVEDVVRAVVAECSERGREVTFPDARAAVRERLDPLADQLGVSETSIVRQYVNATLVAAIAADLIPAEPGSGADAPPMPDPDSPQLRSLLNAARRAAPAVPSIVDALLMAVVYGWMEGHIEGEDLCRGCRRPDVVPDVGDGLGWFNVTSPLDTAPLPAAPYPDVDSLALSVVVANALTSVPPARRRDGIGAVYAAAVAGWLLGHLEGHDCDGCTHRGSDAHAPEMGRLRRGGGGLTGLLAVRDGRPGSVNPAPAPLARFTGQ